MPVPAMLAAAAPWALSFLGSLLPQIVDGFRGAKSEDEVAKLVKPKYQEMVDRLVGGGMAKSAAESLANELIVPELEKAREADPMNPALSLGLSVLGGVGGWKAGARMGKNTMRRAAVDKRRADPTRLQAITAKSAARKPAAPLMTPSADAPRKMQGEGMAMRETGAFAPVREPMTPFPSDDFNPFQSAPLDPEDMAREKLMPVVERRRRDRARGAPRLPHAGTAQEAKTEILPAIEATPVQRPVKRVPFTGAKNLRNRSAEETRRKVLETENDEDVLALLADIGDAVQSQMAREGAR